MRKLLSPWPKAAWVRILDGGIRLVELKNWLGEQPREIRQTVLAQKLVPKDGALDFLIFDIAPAGMCSASTS